MMSLESVRVAPPIVMLNSRTARLSLLCSPISDIGWVADLTVVFALAYHSLQERWPSSCYMLTSDTLVPLHHHTWFGISALCAIVIVKKVDFGSFCLARANSTASMRHRLALYPSMLAGSSYGIVKELSHLDFLCAS
jgi:hypothetical protein